MRISDWSSDVCSSDLALYPVRLGFYYLTYARLGSDAIWLSFPASAFVALVMAWFFYRHPGWRRRAMAEGEAEARQEAQAERYEARREGKEWISTCRSRWSPDT